MIGRTCRAAMGYSFAAGTTDGPGAADIASGGQGMTEGTPLWDTIRDILILLLSTSPPTVEDYACHAPKPVLLPTGFMDIVNSQAICGLLVILIYRAALTGRLLVVCSRTLGTRPSLTYRCCGSVSSSFSWHRLSSLRWLGVASNGPLKT